MLSASDRSSGILQMTGGKGEQSLLGACCAQKKLAVLTGKRRVPVYPGLGTGFLARNLGGSSLKSVMCLAEEVRSSAPIPFSCSSPKDCADL